MFQTTPYIWFLVVSRKLNTLLHQDLLLLNFPVTLIPFLLLPGGPSVGKPFLMIQVGGQKHQLWERTSPWILGRIKKTQRLGNGTKSSGWYKRWYLPYCHGNTNQQQKKRVPAFPCFTGKINGLCPKYRSPKTWWQKGPCVCVDYPKCLIRMAHFWPRLFAAVGEMHWKYLENPKCCLKSAKPHF